MHKAVSGGSVPAHLSAPGRTSRRPWAEDPHLCSTTCADLSGTTLSASERAPLGRADLVILPPSWDREMAVHMTCLWPIPGSLPCASLSPGAMVLF